MSLSVVLDQFFDELPSLIDQAREAQRSDMRCRAACKGTNWNNKCQESMAYCVSRIPDSHCKSKKLEWNQGSKMQDSFGQWECKKLHDSKVGRRNWKQAIGAGDEAEIRRPESSVPRAANRKTQHSFGESVWLV